MTARMPAASSAHTAASREEPQPKFSAVTRILRRPEGRLVEDELGAPALAVVAHIVEQEVGVAGRLPGLAQVPRRDDAVGIDVGQIDRRGDGGEPREGLHVSPPACGRR